MVSLWPWKGEDNSPASFEKTLSALSKKITQTATNLDAYRQRSRRFKALWTLYTTFAYLLYSIILALVLGWQNWGVVEYAAVLGGPVVIYLVRGAASRYFNYRISTTTRHLESLQKQRDTTIEKLKVATKYTSTQQLLEKYGGGGGEVAPKPVEKQQKLDANKRHEGQGQGGKPVGRTGLPPPPTANIIHHANNRGPASPPPPPPPPQSHSPPSQIPGPAPQGPQFIPDEPGFAPNAFSEPARAQVPPYYANPASPPGQTQFQPPPTHHWYDRLLDVLLGEDETQPKNRIVLICTSCRLVNGQAPPGVKSLEEIGRWRCGSCGAWNGEETVDGGGGAKRMLDRLKDTHVVEEEEDRVLDTSRLQSSEGEAEGEGESEYEHSGREGENVVKSEAEKEVHEEDSERKRDAQGPRRSTRSKSRRN